MLAGQKLVSTQFIEFFFSFQEDPIDKGFFIISSFLSWSTDQMICTTPIYFFFTRLMVFNQNCFQIVVPEVTVVIRLKNVKSEMWDKRQAQIIAQE